jgi:hypothetical protein
VTLPPPPPPMPSLPLVLPSNDGSGTMAARCGTPLPFNSGARAEWWLAGFAYDLDAALLPAPPPTWSLSYTNVVANHRQGLRRNALPLKNALGAGFVSSSDEEGVVPRL